MSDEKIRDSRNPFSIAGLDGIAMLFLSGAVTILTAGFSFIGALFYTYRIAKSPWKADERFHVLVTLGKRLDDGGISHDYKLRLDRALSLYSNSADSRILIVGGRRGKNEMTEAEAGRDYLVSKNVSVDNILLEDKSRHTLENLQEARKIIASESAEPPALISNRYHLARCGIMANGLGIKHVLCPAEEKLTLDTKAVLDIVVEAFYTHWYIVGMVFSTATKNKKMLSRIR
ncbi:hypothetical protein MNBD_NITROSPINAE04-289 [hydrothermal vent metagenome]|uniref:DUF218 domain-containing protein n=1 Tax=hydrothermal vent metagenome TaxID=652676 RepID=A0A3B1CEG8_9ZZZZ